MRLFLLQWDARGMVFAVALLSILCQILLSQCHHAIVLALCWPESLLEFHGDVSWFKEIFGPRASVRHIL